MKKKETHHLNWSATEFFEQLTDRNKLAREKHFAFRKVSGLSGFEEAINSLQNTTAFVCVSDISQGKSTLDNTPHMDKVKTVFLAMRHPVNDMARRMQCMATMHELFRQFCTVLIKEKTRLEQDCIYIDERITFQEIDRYFLSGCACAYFQITVTKYVDMVYRPEEWEE